MKKFIAITALVFLAACTTTQKQIVVSKQAPEITIVTPAKPRPIKTEKVKIVVYDREALEKALQDPDFRRIIGMSEKDYRAISNNYAEAIRFIEAQTAVIEYYESVIQELKNRKIVEEKPI